MIDINIMKHYVGSGLECLMVGSNKIYKFIGIVDDNNPVILQWRGKQQIKRKLCEILPLLKPLSKYNEIGWFDEDENEINLGQYMDNGLFFHNILERNDVPIEAVIHLMEELYQGRYDIHNLIASKEAIDANTSKEYVKLKPVK